MHHMVCALGDACGTRGVLVCAVVCRLVCWCTTGVLLVCPVVCHIWVNLGVVCRVG